MEAQKKQETIDLHRPEKAKQRRPRTSDERRHGLEVRGFVSTGCLSLDMTSASNNSQNPWHIINLSRFFGFSSIWVLGLSGTSWGLMRLGS